MGDAEKREGGPKGTPSVSVSPSVTTGRHAGPVSQFGENLAALRDFVELIEPVLSSRQKTVMKERASHLAPLMCALHEMDPDNFPEPLSADAMSRAYGSDIRVEVIRDSDEPSPVSLRLHGNDAPFRSAVKELTRSGQHMTLLYRNALVSLVSYVEWFVSRILHEHYDVHPGALESDRCLSLKELESLGSAEEARRFIIDQKVEEILRASFEDWVKHFRSHLGLSMGYLDEDMKALVELFQRRNLTVHHGGIINSTYLSRVDGDLARGLSIGQPVPIDRSYVMSAIDLCDLRFSLIGMEHWKKCDAGDVNRAAMLANVNFEHMIHDRWPLAEGLSYFLSRDSAMPERDRLIGQVNYWQALKWQGRGRELEELLEGVDFDAKEPVFRFCLMALRDQLDELMTSLPTAVARGDLHLDWLEEWPIFRELREHEGCIDVLAAQREEPSESNGGLTAGGES